MLHTLTTVIMYLVKYVLTHQNDMMHLRYSDVFRRLVKTQNAFC